MSNGQGIFIVAGARTAIGTFGGALASFRPAELGAIVIREAIDRAGIAGADVQNVVIGTVVPTQPKDAYVSRVAAVNAGIPTDAPAMNVNRLCGSGLQAIVSAAQAIALGEHDVAVAGGAESMSNAPHMVLSARNGQKMGNIEMVDAMLGALHDPFENIHMGVTAENVAERCGISREEQDAVAVESHKRAAAAIAAGYFKEQIVPVEIKTRKGVTIFDTDEHVRADASLEGKSHARRERHQGYLRDAHHPNERGWRPLGCHGHGRTGRQRKDDRRSRSGEDRQLGLRLGLRFLHHAMQFGHQWDSRAEAV